MTLARALLALPAAAIVLTAGAAPAEAYCRSTTCTGDCPRDDDGCKTTGNKLFWASSCVGFSLQRDSSEFIPFKYFEQVAQKSFLEWSELECETGLTTLAFSQLDEVSCHRTEYNSGGTNANIILFQDKKWEYKGVDNNLAKTTVTFDSDTGEILDADIEINHANNNFTISDMVIDYDLQAILTHEVGHLIGLDHSPDLSATMYAGYEAGTTDQRSVEDDDILALCEVYPPERVASCAPLPKGGLGDQCEPPEETGDGGEGEGCTAGASGVGAGGGAPLVFALALAALALPRQKKTLSRRP